MRALYVNIGGGLNS